jgi:hypothetical protein
VTVASKLADVLIPIGVFCAVGSWHWGHYAFAAASTLVCLPLLWLDAGRHLRAISLVVAAALTLQGSLAPLLVGGRAHAMADMLVFAGAVLIWRAVWCLTPYVWRGQQSDVRPGTPWTRCIAEPLFILRVLLTVMTQFTFIVAVSSPWAVLAWPILNSTGLLAMVASGVWLEERASRLEATVIATFALLVVARALTL